MKHKRLALSLVTFLIGGLPSVLYADSILGNWRGALRLRSSTCPLNLTEEILESSKVGKRGTFRIRRREGAIIRIRSNGEVRLYNRINDRYCSLEDPISFLVQDVNCTVLFAECVKASGALLGVNSGLRLMCVNSQAQEGECGITVSGKLLKIG